VAMPVTDQEVVRASPPERDSTGRGVLVVRGAAALAFGLTALLWPGLAVGTLAALFAGYALANAAGLMIGVAGWPGRGAYALLALVHGAAGVAALAWPDITAAGLAGVVAAWALATGAVETRLTAKGWGRWTAPLVGVASGVAAAAVLLVSRLGGGAVAVVVGVHAVVTGVLLLAEVRRRQQVPYRARHRPVPAGG
jgi:uncharacterized membrane protein HdeD (DUF308 family)